jgi:RNA polymerase sigma-70 factor (ECF subfamily)
MAESSAHTTQLHRWLDRLQAGDRAAADELVRGICGRVEHLAHSMLRRFPNVRRWADTGDVLQNVLLRLMRTLDNLRPASMRDFYNLAAVHIRRELLYLARHFAGANRHELLADDGDPAQAPDPPAPAESGDLERLTRFHEQWEQLPTEEREVVGLIFYHGWTQAQVAELLGVNVRTVRRRWKAALVRLHGLLQPD